MILDNCIPPSRLEWQYLNQNLSNKWASLFTTSQNSHLYNNVFLWSILVAIVAGLLEIIFWRFLRDCIFLEKSTATYSQMFLAKSLHKNVVDSKKII